jgi:thiamine kinase-like enzyme
MVEESKLQKTAFLPGLERKIIEYLGKIPPQVLYLESCETIEILAMTPGAYNLNYHIAIDGERFIFRVNIQQQSGLIDQIEYEYKVMQYLSTFQISPKVYHLDKTKSFFDFDILIEEYLEGPHISLDEAEMPGVAALLVKLHSLDLQRVSLITWNDPLADTYRLVLNDLDEYEAKKSAEERVIKLAKKFLDKVQPVVRDKRSLFNPDGINHTDVAVDNFIRTSQGLKLIDWEKPRFDDCSYDVCCFLSEPAQLWCMPKALSQRGREIFLSEYARLSGKDCEQLLEKVQIREPLVSLHWVFWGMNRMCDLRDHTTASELQQVHQERLSRWERIADPLHIEKLLTIF